jgi:hypothetical protein
VAGSLAILMTARIARRLTRSTLLGCVAGLLLALDGLELVLSRTGVLAAFGLIVIDRDRTGARLAAAAADGSAGDRGPPLGIRWLLVLAGICLGLACGTKWNGVWYIPAFAVLVTCGCRKPVLPGRMLCWPLVARPRVRHMRVRSWPAGAWDDLRLVGLKLIFLIVTRSVLLLGFVAAGVVVEGRRDPDAAPSARGG